MTSASWFRRGGAVALLLLAGVAAWAASSPDPVANRNIRFRAAITGYPDSPTKKVSGTNESFTVNVTAVCTEYYEQDPHWDQAWISYVKITIGGETVKEWAWDNSMMGSGSLTYSVRWATTHFDHNTTKEVKVEAKCKVQVTGGPVTEYSATDATVSVSIYNYGFACEIPEKTNGSWSTAGLVAATFGGMNHFEGLRLSVTQAQCLTGIWNGTVFYFFGHGGTLPSWFGGNAGNWCIYGFDTAYNVRDQRYWAAQAGLPVANFAFVDACFTGNNNNMASWFLYPVDNWTDGEHFTIDRAEMGWRIAKDQVWSHEFAPHFFAYLEAGQTVNASRTKAFADLVAYLSANPDFPQLGSSSATVNLGLWGDQQARLHALYDGTDDEPSTQWHKVTP